MLAYMNQYNVTVIDDMGHIEIKSISPLPNHIKDLVYSKFRQCTIPVQLKIGHGIPVRITTYAIKPSYQSSWTYYTAVPEHATVNVHFQFSNFDPTTMDIPAPAPAPVPNLWRNAVPGLFPNVCHLPSEHAL